MYAYLLASHSFIRWFVLASLVFTVIRAWRGWRLKKPFTKTDNGFRHWTATIAHIQLVLGLSLYFISPLVAYFLNHFKQGIHQREIRFFGMEHSLVMFTAILVITIGSGKAKRKQTDEAKFKTMAIWFTIGLLLILSSVPWPFSPLISRPYFRTF